MKGEKNVWNWTWGCTSKAKWVTRIILVKGGNYRGMKSSGGFEYLTKKKERLIMYTCELVLDYYLGIGIIKLKKKGAQQWGCIGVA